jgi:hypothetical protein
MAKAFDSVMWQFLLEVLRHIGFPQLFINWITTLLSTASTRVLINGNPRHRICHGRGLQQGDPLSHMLFLLVMEVLHTLIQKGEDWSLLQGLGVSSIRH